MRSFGAAESLVDPALAGDHRAVARLLSHVEESLSSAARVLALVADRPRAGLSVGFVGPPGVGKSSLVTAVVASLLERDRRVVVLANDPSSAQTGGAFLGDRVRLLELGRDPRLFVRSVAARDPLRSLNATTFCAVALLTRLGFDDVVVEAVGAGQSDLGTSLVADTTVLVLSPGLGDDVQSLKSGLIEVADVIAVNKSDLPDSKRTAADLRQAIKAGPPRDGWAPPVVLVSALERTGIETLADAIAAHRAEPPTPDGLRQELFVDLVLFEASRRLREHAARVDVEGVGDTDLIRRALEYVDAAGVG